MKIAVIGSNMVDLISYINKMPVAGETVEAPNFSIGCGGKGANQAVAAAKYGADVLMMTKVGDDIFADNTIKNFDKLGIDTKYVEKVKGLSSGVAPIFVDESGQNRIIIVKGANKYLLPSDIDRASEELKKSSLIILQLEINLETVYYAINFGKKYRLCHNKQLINSHFYRGVSELPYKLLFAVIYTHLEFRYEVSHTITSHHVHHFHQTRIPDGTLLDYMVQYRKPLFPQFFLYPKKFLPENNPHHKEFHLRPYIQNNANQ